MKVAMYVRVSTQRQAQTQTIEQQLDRLREQSRNQGWLWCDEHIFRDDGYSGAKLRRPGLDRLRDQVRAGAFDRVIITAPDRLARNYVHQVLLMEELERGGCHVEFVEHPMSQDPHDQLLLQIRGAVAEYERSLIAERMRRGRQQNYQAGCLLPWTRPPYGYRVDPARPRDPAGARLEPDEAAVVAEIFETYAQEKQSLMGITKQLMERRVPTPSGRQRWNQATVHGIVSNPIYTGTVYIGRTRATEAHQRHSPLAPIGRVRGGHTRTDPAEWVAVAQVPPIVSQEVFDQVQVKLAQNQQFASRHNTTHAYLLRALVSCGVCHLSCMGRSSTAGYAYYTCRGKNQMIVSCRDEKCHSRFIPAGQLDELVWQDVCEVLTHPETIAAALQRAQGGHWLPQALQARRENLRKARVSLEHQIERLTDAYLATVLQLAEYKRRHQELEHRRHSIAEQVRQLEASVGRHDELAAMVQSIDAFCQRVQQGLAEATFDQRRQLIELLVDRVVVTGEEVEIRYVIPTSPTSEHLRFCHLRSDYFSIPKSWQPNSQHVIQAQAIGQDGRAQAQVQQAVIMPGSGGNQGVSSSQGQSNTASTTSSGRSINISFSGSLSGPLVVSKVNSCGVSNGNYVVDVSGSINGTNYHVTISVGSYQGPGQYYTDPAGAAGGVGEVAISNPNNNGDRWGSLGQHGSVTVNSGEKSGSVSTPVLNPVSNGQAQVTGSWTCP